jgi:hypothetical protein
MKQEMDAPERGKGNDYKYDSAAGGKLPAEDPADNVKLEKPNGAPVQPADDKDRQCDFIQFLFPLSGVVSPEKSGLLPFLCFFPSEN